MKSSRTTEIGQAAALLLQATHLAANERAVVLPSDQKSWSSVLTLAGQHCVRPLLHRFLNTHCSEVIPAETLASLQNFTQSNLRRNLHLTGELLITLRQFESEHISAIPYKGPTLAALAYGDLQWREAGDLDLLIDKNDLSAATELLRIRGYEPEISLTVPQAARFASACNVLAFWNAANETSIELHWELSPKYLPFSPAFDQLRQRMIPAFPGGQRVMTLSLEDLLLYLCLHGAKHVWERLSWIADIAQLVHQHPAINWDSIIRQAEQQHCERMLWQGLLLARDLSGLELPAEVERRITRDPTAQELTTHVTAWLFANSQAVPGNLTRSLFFLQMQSRWSDRGCSLWHLLTTPSVADWQFLPLPGALSFAYSLLRPLRLLNHLGQKASGNSS